MRTHGLSALILKGRCTPKKQNPRIERVDDLLFEGEEQVFHLIGRIVSPLGLRVDEAMPYVDARLADGSRVDAIIPPFRSAVPS